MSCQVYEDFDTMIDDIDKSSKLIYGGRIADDMRIVNAIIDGKTGKKIPDEDMRIVRNYRDNLSKLILAIYNCMNNETELMKCDDEYIDIHNEFVKKCQKNELKYIIDYFENPEVYFDFEWSLEGDSFDATDDDYSLKEGISEDSYENLED